MKGLEHLENDYELALFLQQTLIGFATNSSVGGTPEDFTRLREYFLRNPATKPLMPSWIRMSRSSSEFWQFIQPQFSTYAARRHFIREEMNPLLEHCESYKTFPAQESISEVLQKFDEDGINAAWQKALERKVSDPAGAITLSRTILESVCKFILDEREVEYDAKRIELSSLYSMTAKELKLSPDQHTEGIFKQILGGCSGVINGLGQVRNKLGDAHGKGKRPVKPAPRHAALAVNLAGTMALFLVETHDASKAD